MLHASRPGHAMWGEGERESALFVDGLVDPRDPAVQHIVRAGMQLREFGFDPSDPDIARRAVEAGRRAYERDPSTVARRYIRESVAARHGVDPDASGEVVYYMRIGNRVKIGWSTSLASRLATINPEELMATELGGRKLEHARHQEFRELHSHGEWFRLESPLVEHIEQLRS